jgi:hypothetical protein
MTSCCCRTLCGNKEYTIKEFPKLNPMFQTCRTGLPSEYGEIEETIAPAVLEFVGEWIKQTARRDFKLPRAGDNPPAR